MPLVDAVNLGVKGSEPQPSAWKGLFAVASPPSVERSSDSVCSALQLVGLTMKPGRVTSTSSERMRVGIPSRIVGSVVVTTTCEV